METQGRASDGRRRFTAELKREQMNRVINTLRRDYFASADLASAQTVLAQIPEWFADYNAAAPHSALGFRSPLQYRSERSQFDLAEPVS